MVSSDDGRKQELQSITQAARKVKAKVRAVEAEAQLTARVVDDCAIHILVLHHHRI